MVDWGRGLSDDVAALCLNAGHRCAIFTGVGFKGLAFDGLGFGKVSLSAGTRCERTSAGCACERERSTRMVGY